MANGNGLTAKEMAVLHLIEGAARSGRRCPGNRVVADVLGSRDVAGMSRIVRRLEAKGWIAVEQRGRLPRVVTVLATGLRTFDVRDDRERDDRRARRPKSAPIVAHASAVKPSGRPVFDMARGFEAPPATTCRFILGRPEAHPKTCGRTVYRRSYCRAHYALCYEVRVGRAREVAVPNDNSHGERMYVDG